MPVRALERSDSKAAVELAMWQRLDRLHPSDQAVVDGTVVRRRFHRRYGPAALDSIWSLACFRGGRLVAFVGDGDGVHPVTRERERHLLDVFCAPGEVDALGELVARVIGTARADGVDTLRADVGVRGSHAAAILAQLAGMGFVEDHLVVRKPVKSRVMPEGEFLFTPAAHRGFALECIRGGITNALQGTGWDVDDRRIRRYVGRRFGRLATATRWSLLALQDGRPRAHALVQLVPADLRRAHEALIHDIFVPPAWKGQGWSARLLAWIEHLLHQRTVDRVEGTVVQLNDPQVPQLLSNLSRDGWWPEVQSLVMPLTRRLQFDAAGPAKVGTPASDSRLSG
jgi:hypothetical protein